MFSYTLLLVCIAALIDKELAIDCKTRDMFSPADPANIVIQWKTFTVDQDTPCPLPFLVGVFVTGLQYIPPPPYSQTQNAESRPEDENYPFIKCNVTSSAVVSPDWIALIVVNEHQYRFQVRNLAGELTTDCNNIRFMVYYHMGNLTYVAPPSNTEDK